MESSGGDGGGGGGGGNVPEDANDHCPGTQSENAGKEEPCAGCPNQQVCATAPKGPDPDLPAISDRMSNVKHKILVMSGKGGVGKILGVIENMSGLRQAISDMRFVKPSESGETDVTDWALEYIKEKAPDLLSVLACSEAFDSSKGGAEKMCHEMGVPFLGKVPMDPQLGKAVEEGRSCFNDQKCSASAPALKQIIEKLIKHSKTS
ncbi:unnamed protein product [Urochloa decumbens]|uniref:Uncharacterized protein n=1 Tax=Urochloa decumbens TaxID=240449 RepID=A0ABC9F3V2_9POAL